MSDESVFAALRSAAPLVVVEAPAGCGKTHQGADYAREVVRADRSTAPLILTHTHAACTVFSDRTRDTGSRVEIKTIDSVIANIASAYYSGLGLPADPAAWIRQHKDGHAEVAVKVATLLRRYPMIAHAMAQRHPVVICDEHQDSSGDQHSIVMALLSQGAKLRLFADPMQKIFPDETLPGCCAPCDWDGLTTNANAFEQLDTPHRWSKGCGDLGRWTLAARRALKTGGQVDLRKGAYPSSVQIVFAENVAKRNLEFSLTVDDRKPVDVFEHKQTSLLVLTHHNHTARSFRGFFNRRIPLWEGHTRTALEKLVDALGAADSTRDAVAAAIVTFIGEVGKGFSPSAFGNRFEEEVRKGCVGVSNGKPRLIQQLAQFIVDEPNHRGTAKMLRRLSELKSTEPAFAAVEIDCSKEFWDAINLGDFEATDVGLAEMTNRRTYSRPKPPAKAISTIHKAKGLECDAVILMPCDAKTFPDKPEARCLLYVALSRARNRLLLVVSRANPSPLVII